MYYEIDLNPRDIYGRLLLYVYLPNLSGSWLYEGQSFVQVNEQLAALGYASTLTISPNVLYVDVYRQAQSDAQTEQLGIWKAQEAAEVQTSTTSTTVKLKYDPSGPDRDCGDFTYQSDAQAFFEAAGGPARDPHRLDSDDDGIPCETLP